MVTSIQLGNIFSQNGKNVVSGGNSGFDIEGLINGLADAKRLPAVALEENIEDNAIKATAFQTMKQLLADFKDAASFLRNPPGVNNEADNIFEYRAAQISSNTAVAGNNYLSVNAEPGAPVGEYDVTIDQIATRNVQTTDTFAVVDEDTSIVGGGGPLNAGTLLLGPNAVAINLEAGDSINEVIGKVNALKGTSKVEASYIKVSDGNYRLSFKTTETGAAVNYDITGGSSVILADGNGEISFEAESFTSSTTGSINGIDYTAGADAGASGGQAVTTPNNGDFVSPNFDTESPALNYDVYFDAPGTYYLHALVNAPDAGSDSVAFGLDGGIEMLDDASANAYLHTGSTFGSYLWTNDLAATANPAAITVDSAGVHQVNLWMREDGMSVDKIVLSTDSGFVPAGTGPAPTTGSVNSTIFNVGFAVSETAVDAQMTIDGTVITRDTNNIDDVIDGLTFNLSQDTPLGTELTVDVDADTELAQSGIINFVDAYNAFRLFASAQTETDSSGRPTDDAALAGDSTLGLTLNRIYNEMSQAVTGVIGDDFSRLADLGIVFSDFPGDEETPFTRNIMTVDADKLETALSTDFDAVRGVFEFDYTSDDINLQVFSRTNGLGVTDATFNIDRTNGIYQATYLLNGVSTTVDLDVETNTSNSDLAIKGKSGTALDGLILIYSDTDDSTVTMHFSQGIGDKLYNTIGGLLEEDTGVVDSAIVSLEEKDARSLRDILRIDEQIERYREQLLEQFSALERAISQANTLLESLDAQSNARNNN